MKIFSPAEQKVCLTCLMLPPSTRNEHLGTSNICCEGTKFKDQKFSDFPKSHTQRCSMTQKYFIDWGAKNIPFSGCCHLSGRVQSLPKLPTKHFLSVPREQQFSSVITHSETLFHSLRFLSVDFLEPSYKIFCSTIFVTELTQQVGRNFSIVRTLNFVALW